MDVRDPEGRQIARIDGLHLKRANPAALRRAIAAGVSDLLYTIEWRPVTGQDGTGHHGLHHPRGHGLCTGSPSVYLQEEREGTIDTEHGHGDVRFSVLTFDLRP